MATSEASDSTVKGSFGFTVIRTDVSNSLFRLSNACKTGGGRGKVVLEGGLIWSKWTDLFGYPLKTCQMVPNDGKTTFFGVEIISKGVYPGFYE